MHSKKTNIQNLLSSYKDIIWDYDDTLSETVKSKGQAYSNLFSKFPIELKNFIETHHNNNPGMSRQKKLPIYLSKSKDYKAEKIINLQELNNSFEKKCINILINTPLIKEIEEYIKSTKSIKNHHILTNMPQKEIETVIQAKKIKHYFKSINGSSINKSSNLKKLIRDIKNKSEVVFIGDSVGDYKAAEFNKIDFVLKESKYNYELQENIKQKI